MEVFKDYAYYYNLFYEDKCYNKEAMQVDFLLKKYGSGINNILNLGCGTGRHDIELARIGYQCTGIDMSPLMIEIAAEKAAKENINIEFDVADIRNYKPQKKYDAVLSLFHVMSYQNKNQDILLAFQTARKALTQGGILLFDVWYGPGVLSDKPSVRIKEKEDDRNKLIRIARPKMFDKENLVDVNYEILVIEKETGQIRIINENHHMRYFFRPELEFFLNKTEFELLDNFDCITLGETDYNSWTSYFVAKVM